MTISDATALAADTTIARYPVNIRLTVPFLPRSFFVTLIVGPERRAPERRREERLRHPLTTRGNLATMIGGWTVFTVAALFAAFVIATI
jgi:hypothetical protein